MTAGSTRDVLLAHEDQRDISSQGENTSHENTNNVPTSLGTPVPTFDHYQGEQQYSSDVDSEGGKQDRREVGQSRHGAHERTRSEDAIRHEERCVSVFWGCYTLDHTSIEDDSK